VNRNWNGSSVQYSRTLRCDLCGKVIETKYFRRHERSKGHQEKLRIRGENLRKLWDAGIHIL
jgi:hypothetical protein